MVKQISSEVVANASIVNAMQILKQAYQACNAKWLSSNNPTYKDLDYLATLMLSRAMAHLSQSNRLRSLYTTLPTVTIELYRRITKLEINISVSIMSDPERIGHYVMTVEPDLVLNKHYKSLIEAVAGVQLAIIDELEYQLKDV